jgi:hypothetical protein
MIFFIQLTCVVIFDRDFPFGWAPLGVLVIFAKESSSETVKVQLLRLIKSNLKFLTWYKLFNSPLVLAVAIPKGFYLNASKLDL